MPLSPPTAPRASQRPESGPAGVLPMPSLAQILADASARLSPVTETPRLDAEILLAHALGVSRAQLLARLRESVSTRSFEALLDRRLASEPIAYILGEWEFFSLTFEVEAPVLVPRPETEHLVEVVLEFVREEPALILDIGTGTGCIAVALAYNAPRCRVVATDLKSENLALGRRNAQRHKVLDRVEFRQGSLFDVIRPADGLFDVVCSNPPYIEDGAWDGLPRPIRDHEDRTAVLAGPKGLDVITPLVCQARRYLRPGGLLAFEMGMGQNEAVNTLLKDNSYEDAGYRADLAGIERIAFARMSS